jgi:hypothetical protein
VRGLLWSVIGIVALVACGDPSTQIDPNAQSPSSAVVVTTTAPATHGSVPESLAFSAPRVGGGTVDLSDYAGTPVLLWFWAPT